MIRSRTPRDILTKLHENTVKALRAPETQERLGKLGAEPMIMSPQAFDGYIRSEIADNAKLIKAAAIPVN